MLKHCEGLDHDKHLHKKLWQNFCFCWQKVLRKQDRYFGTFPKYKMDFDETLYVGQLRCIGHTKPIYMGSNLKIECAIGNIMSLLYFAERPSYGVLVFMFYWAVLRGLCVPPFLT